jgi:hypothetical protein
LIDYQEVQRACHEPEVGNEWSGASTPLIPIPVGLRDSIFARMRQYVSPGVYVGQYKRGVTWIWIYIYINIYKRTILGCVCLMKY